MDVKRPSEIIQQEEEAARNEYEAEESAEGLSDFIPSLASYVRNEFNRAVSERDQVNSITGSSVSDRMINAIRARMGQYSDSTLQGIRANGGSEIYVRVSASKARSMSGWLRDVLLGQPTPPWDIEATPEPEIPAEDYKGIQERVASMMTEVMMAASEGLMPPPTQEMLNNEIVRLVEQKKKDKKQIADKAVENVRRKIEDKLQEGGFYTALDAFIDDMMVYPTAILKGPVVRRKAKLRWGEGGVEVEQELVSEFERVNPMDIYPSPEASNENDGAIFQKHKLSRAQLNELIGVPGYDEEAIRRVLNDHCKGASTFSTSTIDSAREDIESRDKAGLIDAIEFYGSIQGKMLIEYGMTEEEIDDPDLDYECCVWIAGDHVIKAYLNPDPLNRRPYHIASFESIPDSFWGLSLIDILEDVQAMCNSCARAIDRNMAISSGPMGWFDPTRFDGDEDATDLYPWRMFPMRPDVMGSGTPPMSFFQPNSNSQELFFVFEKFYTMADEISLVPRYMQGMPSSANRTASGLSMLMNAASKGVKHVIGNIDFAVTKLVERIYQYILLYEPDEHIRPDCQVVALGTSLLNQKELQQMRLTEFLQASANPLDSELMGPEGRMYLLREVAKSLGVDADKVVPESPLYSDKQQMQNPMQGMAPGANANNMGIDGGAPAPTPGSGGQQLMDGSPTANVITPQRGQ